MIIFPAIDIKNQQCVRLEKGDFNLMNTYDIKPLDAALAYQKEGASWLHIIDLDGAKTGKNKNIDVIKSIVEKTNLKIQFGGGIRSKEKIIQLLSMGIDRVIVGTYAVESFIELKDLVKTYPGRIIASLDAKHGSLVKRGWQAKTSIKAIDFIKQLETIGIDTVVVTDIDKDGMMQGPNMSFLKEMNRQTSINIIASGGVSSIDDIKILSRANIYGAIVGKALYLNKFKLKEAIKCSQEESSLV